MINFRKRKENPEDEQNLNLTDNPETSDKMEVSARTENTDSDGNMEVSEEQDPESAEDVFLAEAEAYARGRGLDDEQLRDALDFIEGMRRLERDESPTLQMLETVLCGLDYHRAISEAKAAGELAGRNKQIEEIYMRPAATDGLPHLGDGGAARKKNRTMTSIFDLARSAG